MYTDLVGHQVDTSVYGHVTGYLAVHVGWKVDMLERETHAEPAAGPAAGHRVVWQVADGGAAFLDRTLRQMSNLLADLGEGAVEIEVVAHGAGLDLLLGVDGTGDAVAGLRGRGVTFLACENTLRSRNLTLADLVDGVRCVPSGVGALVRRQAEGWSYLRA